MASFLPGFGYEGDVAAKCPDCETVTAFVPVRNYGIDYYLLKPHPHRDACTVRYQLYKCERCSHSRRPQRNGMKQEGAGRTEEMPIEARFLEGVTLRPVALSSAASFKTLGPALGQGTSPLEVAVASSTTSLSGHGDGAA
jgi:hypothetical protein